MGIVHTILSRMFDCMIVTLSTHEDDLLWLIPIVITPTTKKEQPKSKDEIHMEYKIPELPDTDTITIKFKILDLIKILTVYVFLSFKICKYYVGNIIYNIQNI